MTTTGVPSCEACQGHSLKVGGYCVLHYVAKTHSLDEIEEAREEVLEA